MTEQVTTSSEPSEKVIQLGEEYAYRRTDGRRRVGVVGAGPAGLGALRRLAEAHPALETICFEQAPVLGGTWLYTEATGKDSSGLPLHSSIYKNLRTNLPKEVMNYPNYPYPEGEKSYIEASEVLDYLKDFATVHDLEKYIKYGHRVTKVKPLVNLWSLSALDLSTSHEHHYIFDAIIICSGPNITPVYPQVELAKFSGQQLHSKEYKVPEPYTGKTVLLIGYGPSGLDIAFQLAPVANKVFLSCNRKGPSSQLPDNVILKPTVKSLEDKTAFFSDASEELIDCIIHCTGYTYNFPFLDSESGLTVDQFVFPLYKHFISIERPTLCIIGLPKFCSHLYLVDFQVRCFLKTLDGEASLPSKEDMMKDWEDDIAERRLEGQRKKDYHKMGKERTDKYFADLSALGGLEPIPPVQITLFKEAFRRAITDFKNFRDDVFKIVDDETFERIQPA